MRRLLLLIPFILLVTGAVLAQTTATPSFELVRQIGEIAPQGVKYDPNFDRLAMVDADGRLLLVNASTYEVQHVLYETGAYSGYEFSHDGRFLALGLDTRVELWDTQTGQEDIELALTSALSIAAQMHFSDDDTYLMFTAIVRAPDDIRRSETDTSLTPWIWDLAAERDERDSALPEDVIAQPFFDLRNGFVLGPNNIVMAARPRSIDIFRVTPETYRGILNLETPRYERDPMDLWVSERGEQMYFRPLDGNGLFQIDTANGIVTQIPIGRELNYASIRNFEALALADQARIIGEPATLRSNSFLRLLLGDNYHSSFNEHPLTVTLVDILRPLTVSRDQAGLLIYIFDEQTGRGVLDFVRPVDIINMALHPDDRHFMVRRSSGQQPIELYDLDTGNLEFSVVPAMPDPTGEQLFTFSGDGESILTGWQRLDAETGEVIIENLNYHPGFERFYFTPDSQSLITMVGSNWWQWDINTGDAIRRQNFNLRGSIMDISQDARRYLTSINVDDRIGVEVADTSTGERLSVLFENVPGRSIENIYASPDWEHFLVTYSANSYTPYYPGNEIAVYSLREGLLWFLAGDDLPPPDGRSYSWLDAQTVLIAGTTDGGGQPVRVYGLEYHPSGLPACLVDSFPDDWTRWQDLWERLNQRLRADSLGLLTQKLCDALPGTVEDVEAVFFPSPTPTRLPVTAVPAVVAGLPSCISRAFPGQALQYAQEWRAMTEGLAPEQVKELELILCEGLEEGIDVPPPIVPANYTSNLAVMTLDIRTGNRSVGTFFPPTAEEIPALRYVLDEFRRTQGFEPQDAILSPDRQFLAARTPFGHVAIYRLVRPYSSILADIQATAEAIRLDQPDTISLAPTATQPFSEIGEPRPTMTPTVTPTPPPTPAQVIDQPAYGQIDELCADDQLYTVGNLPLLYNPSGRILVETEASSRIWVYDPMTGIGRPDETLNDTTWGSFSFDGQWVLLTDREIAVARADGEDYRVLYTAAEQPVWPSSITWRDTETLEIVYTGYLPEESADPMTLVRTYNVNTGEFSEPVRPEAAPQVNQLSTEVIAWQPNNGPLAVVATSFNAGLTTGYKYYIYDRTTDTAVYFARISDGNRMEFIWHPLGRVLYYRYPSAPDWFVFDPASGQHRRLGTLPGGIWSPDARYRVAWFLPSEDQVEARREAGQPIPKLAIWDSVTGLTRHYCIPTSGEQSFFDTPLYWSPDSRYLLFQVTFWEDSALEVYRPRTLILDTQTGSVTEFSIDISRVLLWTE